MQITHPSNSETGLEHAQSKSQIHAETRTHIHMIFTQTDKLTRTHRHTEHILDTIHDRQI